MTAPCPGCLKQVEVTPGGVLAAHRFDGVTCEGSRARVATPTVLDDPSDEVLEYQERRDAELREEESYE